MIMNVEYVKILQDPIKTYSRYYPNICVERVRKTTEISIRMTGTSAKIETT
jgi:hypothetical protein